MVLSASSNPIPFITENFKDYIIHGLGYGFLIVVLIAGFSDFFRNICSSEDFLIIFMLAFVFGVSDELHQALTPGRYCSFHDVIADLIGIIISLTAYYLLQKILYKQK